MAEIARRLGRSSSALWQLLGDEPGARAGVGRKAKLTDGDKDRLAKMVDDMVQEADTKCTMAATMTLARLRPRVAPAALARRAARPPRAAVSARFRHTQQQRGARVPGDARARPPAMA